ncbi:hypothetical protein BGZ93_001574 [Podila epicladia]|nr:hypothetical protein BGZ93_001574 [Podila epicladia]
MANQGIMVPPNNAPWPGQKPPSPSAQPQQHPPPPVHHPHSYPTSSPYPPPQYYQHHGHPPPPPHPPHATSPTQQHPQPYYPYPYAYPPHAYPLPPHGHPPPPPHGHPPPPPPPPHGHPPHPSYLGHPGYQVPYYTGPPPGPVDNDSPSGTLSTSSISTKTSNTDTTPKSTKAKASSSTAKTKTKAKIEKTVEPTPDPKVKASTKPVPKTFRFEGSISSESFKTTKSFDLAGVNILNRKPLDTRTALDKLQRRRETHNRVERKRRDCINQASLIDDLTKLLPPKHLEETSSKCHRVNVLRGAVSHIKFLNESNQALTKSIQAIHGDVPLIMPKTEPSSSSNLGDMSMDVDDDMKNVSDEDDDGETQQGRSVSETPASGSSAVSSSRSTPMASPRLTPTKAMAPPPVIITGAPSPSSEREPLTVQVDPYSLESHRQRSNSFASSIGDETSPRSPFPASPMFPPSPVSPSTTGRNLLAPENQTEGTSKDAQLSHGFNQSPRSSPSLPPISSLANMHLQTPSGRLNESQAEMEKSSSGPNDTVTSFSGRPHRTGATLPPLMIPEPHHLHPYHQSNSGTSNSKGSNRNSLTLSPHPPISNSDQPPISPFMLSPMLSRSPSMGPVTSPALSPHSQWGHDGLPSPLGFGQNSPYSSPYYYPHPGADPHQAYHYPHAQHASPLPRTQPQQPEQPTQSISHTRHKSLQPEPIFIQEEPWNTQRKRSTSSASGIKVSSSKSKKKSEPEERPTSPSSVTSSTSYSTSPNPKKRSQKASEVDSEHMSFSQAMSAQASTTSSVKRSKQVDTSGEMGEVSVVVEEAKEEGSSLATNDDEDAAQALTSLARTT